MTPNNFNIRLNLVVVGTLLVFAAILARAFYLQIYQADFLEAQADQRHQRWVSVPAVRGNIYDRHGQLLAMSTPVLDLWIDPKVVFENHQAWQPLGDFLHISVQDLQAQLQPHAHKRFRYLKRGLTPEEAAALDVKSLEGVYYKPRYKRYYPQGETFGHLLGFTDREGKGIAGLEMMFEKSLEGHPGKAKVVRDLLGHVVGWVGQPQAPQAGQDLRLTLDANLQYFTYRALKKAMVQHQSKAAGAIVADAKTGEVLALVSQPGFNPNDRLQLKDQWTRNRVFTDMIEPGSVVKPLMIASALELGKVQLDDTFTSSSGYLNVDGFLVNDPYAYGKMTLTDIVRKSSNVGAVEVAAKLTPEELWRYYQFLGFGERSGLDFPGEVSGYMKLPYEWNRVTLATAAYGYGFNITPIQLLKAYMVLANQGQTMDLTLLQDQPTQPTGKQVFSPQVTQAVLQMMESVTQRGGTGRAAAIQGYSVAGKTGTVHKTKGNGYNQNQYAGSFVGLVPAKDPQLVMVVWLDQPSRGKNNGGDVAAPVFREVMTEALRLRHIRPVWDAPQPPEEPVHSPEPKSEPKPEPMQQQPLTPSVSPLAMASPLASDGHE